MSLKEKAKLHCRCDPPNPGNPRPCVGCCTKTCARLPVDLAEKLSLELQEEWAKGQAKLMRLDPHSPDIADERRLPQQLREKWEQAQMQTPTGRPEPGRGAMHPPAWGDSAGCVSFE